MKNLFILVLCIFSLGLYAQNPGGSNKLNQTYIQGPLKTDSATSIKFTDVTKSFVQKTLFGVGDSYTQGSGASNTAFKYLTRLSTMLNMTENNLGVPGSLIQNGTPTNPSGATSLEARVSVIPVYNASTSGYLIIMYGYNDVNNPVGNYTAANCKISMSNILDTCTIARGWPTWKIILVPNVFNPASTLYQRETDYRDSLQHLATAKNVKFVDELTAFRSNDSSALIGPDQTHPTDQGHLLLAQLIYRTIVDTIVSNNQSIATNGLTEFGNIKVRNLDTVNYHSRIAAFDDANHLATMPPNRVLMDYGMNFPVSSNFATRGKGAFGGFVYNGEVENFFVAGGMKPDYIRVTGTPATPSLLSGLAMELEIFSGTAGYIQVYNRTSASAANITVQPFGGNFMLGTSTDNTIAKLQLTGKLSVSQIDSFGNPSNTIWFDPSTGLMKKAPAANGVIITSGTVTNAATLDINMSAYNALYSTIEIQLISFRPATNAAVLEMRLSTDGTTFITSGYKWNFMYALAAIGGSQDDAGASDATTIHLTGSSSSTTAQTICGEAKIYNPGVSTFFPMTKFTMARYNDTPATGIVEGMGLITTAQVTKGVRILFSTGNISTGTYKVIGYN